MRILYNNTRFAYTVEYRDVGREYLLNHGREVITNLGGACGV